MEVNWFGMLYQCLSHIPVRYSLDQDQQDMEFLLDYTYIPVPISETAMILT